MINLKQKDAVADSIKSILEKKELSPKQKQIAKMSPPADKIDAGDLSKLRAGHKPVKEAAKPDFLDLDKDGNKKEPMKQAAKQAKMKEEIDPENTTTDTLRGREKKSANPFLSKKVMMDVPGDVNEEEQIDEKEKWIQGAIKKPGALHKQLGVPADKKIPAEKLKAAAEKGGKLGKRANLAMTLKKFKEENEEHSIYDQMIQEVLSKDASAGDWIHDFVHSDNPKFKGKSKEMRKKMALAAYYAKQRNEEVENDICPDCMQDPCVCGGNHIEEEVEQINELSPKTVSSYTDKAYKDYSQRLKTSAATKTADPKTAKRWKGLVGAAKRGPKTHQIPAGKDAVDKSGRPYWGEEVEQIDEAEMKTKTAYVPYVYTDRHGNGFGGYDVHYSKEADAHAHLARHGHMDINGKKGWVEKHEIAKHPSGRWVDANHMRRHRTDMHEEVEQVEENAFDWKKPKAPESKGGAGVKAGRAYGGAAQKSKPEHDDADDKKKVTESKRPETDNVPFEGPYNPTDKPVNVTDKSGAKHTPMSRVKHLARQAMKKVKSEMLGKAGGTSE